jgi:GNAT superfamily N-acetyltransferase
MKTIERILAPPSDPGAPFVLRPHRSGDLGWIVHRHGVLYAEEYGWNEEFEALVAGIAATFLREYDPRRDGSWIAERDGEFLGCVFLVRKSAGVAQLRMLLVEPRARGMGLGTRLVDECIRFATRAGYRRIVLWTYEALADARRIYERAGFRRVRTEKTHSFGHDGTAETWALTLPYRKRP